MKVIVLNADMSFLNETTLEKAHSLLYIKKKAIAITNEYCCILKSFSAEYVIPKIIKLKNYVNRKLKDNVFPVKNNVFIRDNYTCAYCNTNLEQKDCTVDHIIPKSKGGKSTWNNMVTCCKKCNTIKGHKSLKEVGFNLKIKPYTPTTYQFIQLQLKRIGIQDLIDKIINKECGM